jgi:NTP pyrophosphatase (non-canonical NTP hydrolase)
MTSKRVEKRQALYAQIVDQAIMEKQLRERLEEKKRFREFYQRENHIIKEAKIMQEQATYPENPCPTLSLQDLIFRSHGNAYKKGFWEDEFRILTGMQRSNVMAKDHLEYPIFCPEDIEAVRNAFLSQRLILVISEISETVEALRAGDLINFREEIADTLIRLGDLIGGTEDLVDIQQVILEKMKCNELRPAKHGKKF